MAIAVLVRKTPHLYKIGFPFEKIFARLGTSIVPSH